MPGYFGDTTRLLVTTCVLLSEAMPQFVLGFEV